MKARPLFVLATVLNLAGCGSREEGVRLHLWLAHLPAQEAQVEGPTRHFTNDLGEHITLSRAHVTLSSVEIFPCATGSAWRWLRHLSPVGTAHAHSESNPQRLGVPHVSGLERPDGEALALGTLRPPPGSICRARLTFAPADADAEGLSAAADMEDKTLRLEGSFSPAEGGPSQPFLLESSGVFNVELSVEALTLSADTREADLVIHLAYDRWLDGASPSAPEASAQALRNVGQSAVIAPTFQAVTAPRR